MTNLDWLAGAPLKNAIGWTVVHSIWQLTLVALIAYLLLRFIPLKKAEVRYSLLLLALCIGLTWIGITFAREWRHIPIPGHTAQLTNTGNTAQETPDFLMPQATPSLWDQILSFPQQLDVHMPAITLAWLIGICLFSLYLVFGLGYLNYLKYSGVSLPDEAWQIRLNDLARRMGVKKQVRLLISQRIDGPITFQFFRPVIMVPVFFFTGLTPAQMEVLLLHELAHIRRHDFVVNLLQSLVEILFFFHPAIWWLSRSIREEREYCCDNAVIAVRENPFPYVEALTRIQSTQFSHKNRLAMSANGNRSMLSKRVFRLLGRYDREPSRFKSVVIALFLLTISFSAQAFLIKENTAVKLASLPVLEMTTDNAVVANSQEETTASVIPEEDRLEERESRPRSPLEPTSQLTTRDTLPLYVINGSTKDASFELKNLEPEQITAISVLKGEKAIEKYGQAGQFGVVEITTINLNKNETRNVNSNTESPVSNTKVNIRAKSESGETIARGKVFDENNQPLVGANILIKGTRTGTITDFTGEFVLQLPDDCATLIFAYVGRKTVELENICGGEESLEVKLEADGELPSQKPERVVKKPELTRPVINGRVLNEELEPMVGASILVKGMTIGTVSDFQGNFRLQLPTSDCATLIISYVGMKQQLVENICQDVNLGVILEEETAKAPSPTGKPDPITFSNGKEIFSNFNVFPNPSQGEVNVGFQLEGASNVKLGVYTIDGKLVKTIVNQTLDTGRQQFSWSAGAENRGTFLIQLEIDGKVSSKQVIVE